MSIHTQVGQLLSMHFIFFEYTLLYLVDDSLCFIHFHFFSPATEVHEEVGLMSTGMVYMSCFLSLSKRKIEEWTVEVSVTTASL